MLYYELNEVSQETAIEGAKTWQHDDGSYLTEAEIIDCFDNARIQFDVYGREV